MNRPQRSTSSPTPTFNLPAFEEDKRLAFVDSVCATLMTSRFGDGAMYTLNPRFEGTADEPFDFLDTMEGHAVGRHEAATFPGRKRENHLRKRVAMRIGQVVLISGNGAAGECLGRDGPTLKPPTHAGGSPLARGSPAISGTFLFCVFLCELSGLCVTIPESHAKPQKDAKKTQKKFLGRVAETAPIAYSTDADLHLRVKYVSR